mmetsp:Transcript_53969/g.105530  ORF Transcript_53969/g.105530 Transcript_53969/m.105530 type:complete len:104 (+) Transcript_53969:1341-1652(+)
MTTYPCILQIGHSQDLAPHGLISRGVVLVSPGCGHRCANFSGKRGDYRREKERWRARKEQETEILCLGEKEIGGMKTVILSGGHRTLEGSHWQSKKRWFVRLR